MDHYIVPAGDGDQQNHNRRTVKGNYEKDFQNPTPDAVSTK